MVSIFSSRKTRRRSIFARTCNVGAPRLPSATRFGRCWRAPSGERILPTWGSIRGTTRRMNPESDHFASCLLMQAEASRKLLAQNGFDLVSFSRETRRSLPSVVLRLRSLFSIASGERHPHAGVWLFEAPWKRVAEGKAGPADMSAKHHAYLCGFSMAKDKGREALFSRSYFPTRGSAAASFALARIAIETNKPVMLEEAIFDEDLAFMFSIVAEPIPFRSAPWRILLVAVQRNHAAALDGWLQRISPRTVEYSETDVV